MVGLTTKTISALLDGSMNTKVEITIFNRILKLRELLQAINQATFSYYSLNKNYPLDSISKDEAEEILTQYQEIVKKIGKLVKEYEDGE